MREILCTAFMIVDGQGTPPVICCSTVRPSELEAWRAYMEPRVLVSQFGFVTKEKREECEAKGIICIEVEIFKKVNQP